MKKINEYPYLMGYRQGQGCRLENSIPSVASYICSEGMHGDLTITTPDNEFVLNTFGIYINKIADMGYREELLKVLIPTQRALDGTDVVEGNSHDGALDSEQLQRIFLQAVDREVLAGFHWLGLQMAYQHHDREPVARLLKKLHGAFLRVYGTDCLDESYDFVTVPAAIRVNATGEIYAGLVQLDLSSAGEHWDTLFITPCGAFWQTDDSRNQQQKNYINALIPYEYYYTPDIPCDIHVDKENMPYDVREMLGECNPYYLTNGEQEGMSLQ